MLYWNTMYGATANYVSKCPCYQVVEAHYKWLKMQPYSLIANHSLDLSDIDFTEIELSKEDGLILMDSFSNFRPVSSIPSQKAFTMAEIFVDNGSMFTVFQTVCTMTKASVLRMKSWNIYIHCMGSSKLPPHHGHGIIQKVGTKYRTTISKICSTWYWSIRTQMSTTFIKCLELVQCLQSCINDYLIIKDPRGMLILWTSPLILNYFSTNLRGNSVNGLLK